MSDYVTPESDYTRVHYVQRVTSNGPFGYREDETEYGVLVDGKLGPIDAAGHVYSTPYKRDAHDLAETLREMQPGADVQIIHRRVIRDPWFTTTPYDPRHDV